MKPVTVTKIRQMKGAGGKVTMVTAYDATLARLVDKAGIDAILVGDSLGMVVQGHDTTLPVRLEDIIYHTACVSLATKRALVIADLPFLSYQVSRAQAVLNAGRALKEGGAQAVKLEGGMEMVDIVRALTDVGIPVMAHLGLKPQSVHQMGGYKIQGGVAIETADEVTKAVGIPTIGIAAGPHCDGQVLVIYDLLGMNPDFDPKFLKKYMDGHELISDALKRYIVDVRNGTFPTENHGFHRT
jgi:3-methyl-2-oxobutanoate hydroxymethyltransferase